MDQSYEHSKLLVVLIWKCYWFPSAYQLHRLLIFLLLLRTFIHRYSVQVDVLQQLGGKLETSLRQQETQLNLTPRTEAAKRRATLIKLNRDFRRIEGVFKNMVLDTKRQKALVPDQQKRQQPHDVGAGGEQTEEEQRMQLELQLQQDVSSSLVRRCQLV